MRQSITRKLWVMGVVSFWLVTAGVHAQELSYSQVVDGVAVYFGMIPAELVRGHPREHPEGVMHGGVPVGESHLTVAVFDDKTGRRISDAEVTAAELVAWCTERLANYKVPRSVLVVPALPRNATGKVTKGELRAQT